MNDGFPILVAEDDPGDAEILQRALRRVGFNNPVHVCADGEDVVRYLRGDQPYQDRDRFRLPRIVIVDLRMPGMDGFDLLTWIRGHEHCNVIPRIVLSTSREASDIQRAYQLGVNSYIYKPPTFEGLVDRLELVFSYWEMCEKPIVPHRC